MVKEQNVHAINFGNIKLIIKKKSRYMPWLVWVSWLELHSTKQKVVGNCVMLIQWNTMQQKERRSSYSLRQCGWIWRALC